MKRLTAKYSGTCQQCRNPIEIGHAILWARGYTKHVDCQAIARLSRYSEWLRGVVGPCWACKSPNGKFRQYGAATPVYCDECEAKSRAGQPIGDAVAAKAVALC